MTFLSKYKGEVVYLPYVKKASTAFTKDTLVKTDASGFLVAAVAATAPEAIAGIIRRDVVSTDADYAKANLIPIEIPCGRECQYLADVGTGTLTQAMVNTLVDLKDNTSIDVTATAVKQVRIEQFISASKAIVSLRDK